MVDQSLYINNWRGFIAPFCLSRRLPASLYRTYEIGSEFLSNSYALMNTSTASDGGFLQLDAPSENFANQAAEGKRPPGGHPQDQ